MKSITYYINLQELFNRLYIHRRIITLWPRAMYNNELPRNKTMVCRPMCIDSRGVRRHLCALFAVTEEIQQPRLPEVTAVATQTVFINSQCSVHCYVWVHAAGGRSAFLWGRHVIASGACRNIGTSGPWTSELDDNGRKLYGPTNQVFWSITSTGA